MLGDVGLFHPKLCHQLSGGEFPILQQLDNGNPRWMSQRLKDVSLKPAQ